MAQNVISMYRVSRNVPTKYQIIQSGVFGFFLDAKIDLLGLNDSGNSYVPHILAITTQNPRASRENTLVKKALNRNGYGISRLAGEY